MAIRFLAGDPLQSIQRLRDLADDLERMTMFIPRADVLHAAPTLSGWVPSRRLVPAMEGRVEGHPLLEVRPTPASAHEASSRLTDPDAAGDHAKNWQRRSDWPIGGGQRPTAHCFYEITHPIGRFSHWSGPAAEAAASPQRGSHGRQ